METNRVRVTAALSIFMVVGMGLSACATGGSTAGPATISSSPTASTASASARTLVPVQSAMPEETATQLKSLPEGGQWLYALSHESTRPVDTTSVVLAGDASNTNYDHSTSQYMGCEGTPDQSSFKLEGKFKVFKSQVGLRLGTPAGIKAIVDVYLDDELITRLQIDSDGGSPLQVVLTGGQSLKFIVSKTEGECEHSEQGYLAFGNAQVF
ncbi:hypothetical protein SAMN04489740_4342 [Arthrobacter alpinus]|uniref:Glycosyl hydrolase family 98 putative carbohydrate-binding module domain-containing protein n=1 Tax=Arthrobacter alpinus TaxID=656366 RepID=A0A1H5PHQ3_9MICC|nr:hypothetical protein [Arthrobacter alpinus]SEF13184.1 hypothetical protein SAMN04489740_4342 [Arthrobacter alpinus]